MVPPGSSTPTQTESPPRETQKSSNGPISPKATGGRSGTIRHRKGLGARLSAWKKRSPLNPYWLGWYYLDQAARDLAPHAKGKLLDVGVSERPYAGYLDPHVDSYIGMDYPAALESQEPGLWDMLDTVRNTVDVFGDGQALPFASAEFDTVFCTEVIEHLTMPEQCIAEMARVLKPGGHLLMTVPFMEPLHFLPCDYYRFTREALKVMLPKHGLEIVELKTRGRLCVAAGSLASQWILRSLVVKQRQSDGSVIPGAFRQLLALPFYAGVQLLGKWLDPLLGDDSLTLGYTVLARRTGE